MPLILGIVASGNYPRVTNSYESIQTVTVGSGGSSSISFTSIPNTYKHLQIRGIGRGSGSNNTVITVNGASSVYNSHWLQGNGSSASAGADTTTNGIWAFAATGAGNSLASTFGASIIDILDYADTNKFKTFRILNGVDFNGSGEIDFQSGLYRQTTAISSITLTPSSGTVSQYSQFALYGIKG
jgi:hypothetical protein